MTDQIQSLSTALLDGLRVVEVVDVRGALAGRLLADLGADVLRVDAAATRRFDDTMDTHRFRNANKRIVTMEPHDPRFEDHLARADVLIDNVGLVHDANRRPHLVHVSISDMGLSGSRSDWHLEPLPAFAASGALHVSGFRDLPPCTGPGYLAHDCASTVAAIGAVVGVMDRRRTGQGQLVEVSVQEAALAGMIPWSVVIEDHLHINPRLPFEGRRNADGTYAVFEAADGHVRVVLGTPGQWEGFLELCGSPEELTDDSWRERNFRRGNMDVLKMLAGPHLLDRDRAQLVAEAHKLGATVGAIHTLREFVEHPQSIHRRTTVEVDGAEVVRLPIVIDGVRADVAPPDEQADSDPARWDADSLWASPRDAAIDGSAPAGLLLEGVRVVEFGMAAVMPEMNLVLTELGADVIKIESATRPDVLRGSHGDLDQGFAFNVECRGRRSVAIDLATERGRALAFDLCRSADLVTENWRGGVLDRIGLGEQQIRAENPNVIYVSSQGYGRGGPMGTMPAYGPLNSSFAGVHRLWNHPDAPYPCGTSMNHPDHVAGKLLSVAVLAAIDRKRRTGQGADLELAQTEAAAYLVGHLIHRDTRTGVEEDPVGNASDAACPHGVFAAAGDDEWVAVVCPTDDSFARLADHLDLAAELRVATLPDRLARRDEIEAAVTAWTSQRPNAGAAAELQAIGVSAMPVMGPVAHRADPHLDERDFLSRLHHPAVGPETHVGNPLRPHRTRQRRSSAAPLLGADTAEVFAEVLGIPAAETAQLVADGICR